MICAHRAALGGIQLDEIDSRIVIHGVEELAPRENITTAALAGGGSRITGKRRESLDVVVRFGIDVRKEQMETREEILEAIHKWAAAGGIFTCSQKPERRLKVRLAQGPAVGDPWNWTNTYAIIFRAYGIPYWEQVTPASAASGVGFSAAAALAVEGNAKTQADVILENMSGAAISTARITVGGRTMSFSTLGMAGGESLVIDHDEDGLLRIRIRRGSSWRSVMAAREAASADDFDVNPGNLVASFTAQRACRMTVSCRGRWL